MVLLLRMSQPSTQQMGRLSQQRILVSIGSVFSLLWPIYRLPCVLLSGQMLQNHDRAQNQKKIRNYILGERKKHVLGLLRLALIFIYVKISIFKYFYFCFIYFLLFFFQILIITCQDYLFIYLFIIWIIMYYCVYY